MVIKPLHKFKRCLDLYGICNLNYPLGALVVVTDKIVRGNMYFDLDSYLDLAPSLGAFGVHWRVWK